MVVPWRDVDFQDFYGDRLCQIYAEGNGIVLAFKAQAGLDGSSLAMMADKGELYVAAADFMTGRDYHTNRSPPHVVPRNTIYGIGVTDGESRLAAICSLPDGACLSNITKILFSKTEIIT